MTKLFNNPDYKVAQIRSVHGSEVRLAILRCLLEAPRSAAEIVAGAGLKTTGQAYHHLRELERAGYIEQRTGGSYHLDVRRGRVYLAALALAADAGAEEPEETPNKKGSDQSGFGSTPSAALSLRGSQFSCYRTATALYILWISSRCRTEAPDKATIRTMIVSSH